MSITLEDVKNNEEVEQLILAAQRQLDVLGYTEHSHRHLNIVSQRAGEILQVLGYDENRVRLAQIAGYLHDLGNAINRTDHAHTGAILADNILKDMGMNCKDRAEIMMAIGNHDEGTGTAVSDISAAIILADKSDAHRSRVSKTNMSLFDKHDRVNYAVTDAKLRINKEEKKIIFSRFALPKVLKRMGLKAGECVVAPDGLDAVVEFFAGTSGIRDLEQAAEHIAANALYQIEVDHVSEVVFDREMVMNLLG